MTEKRCADIRHDFDKFDDATIYCRKCGEQRVMDVQALIAKLPQPVYLPCPGPHTVPNPWWQPISPWPVITYTSDSTTTTQDVTVWNNTAGPSPVQS